MFTHRRARLGLAKVHTFVHVFLACIALPIAASNDHSVTLDDHPGAAKSVPSMSFTVIEERTNNGPPSQTNPEPYRRSFHRPVNKDETQIVRRLPFSSHYRRANANTNVDANEYVYSTHNAHHGYQSPPSLAPARNIQNPNVVTENDKIIDELEAKLYSCVIFRNNMIIVFGQILRAPNNILTIDQFTSLNMILQTLINKRVYVFNLLSVLNKLRNADKQTQFKLVLQALSSNVPVYMVGACEFWLKEIEARNVDIYEIIGSIKNPADFLTGIDARLIEMCKVKVAAEELEPFDEASQITKQTLGLVFVNILNKLKNKEIRLSQKLFVAILIHFPFDEVNPVLEEYMNYIWDTTQGGMLSSWYDISLTIEYGNPYEIVNFVMKRILSRKDTPVLFRHALQYVSLHLKEVPNTYSDQYYPDMQKVLNNGNYLILLLSMIKDDAAIPELGILRDRLIGKLKYNNINYSYRGLNVYVYQKPVDVLIALLVRIRIRVEETGIREIVTQLLSILITKNALDSFAVTVPFDVDLVLLLDLLILPNSDPNLLNLVKKIKQYLEEDVGLLIKLQGLILKENKTKCQRPVQCLLTIFTKIIDPSVGSLLRVPSNFITLAQELVVVIKTAITGSAKCKANNLISFEIIEVTDDSSNDLLPPVPGVPDAFTVPVLPPSSKPTMKPTLSPMLRPIPTDDPRLKVTDLPTDEVSQVVDTTPSWSADITFPNKGLPTPTVRTPMPTWLPKLPKGKPRPTVPPALITERPIPKENPADVPSKTDQEPILPPNLTFDRPIYIVFPKDDTPPYIPVGKPTDKNDPAIIIEFPPIKDLLKEFDPSTPFRPEELPDMPELIPPLKKLLGLNFVHDIFGKVVDKTQYPTVISLLTDLLLQALENPKVKANPKLVLTIEQYLKGIDYVSVMALFPVVIDSQKLPSDVLHLTFDPDNPNANSIDPQPPERIPAKFITLPIYHPKYWVMKVDPHNPYGTLLPNSDDGKDNPIQELINDGSLNDILGPNFDPILYPNRGMLLSVILQKLIVSHRVKSDALLMKKLSAYLKSIKNVALYTKVPKEYYVHIVELQQNNQVHWQPDMASLIIALPPPRNQHEANKINLIEAFLEAPNLISQLQISNLSYGTTRGALLKMIFDAAIRGKKVILDPRTLAALIYYENKISLRGHGALPIVWVWVQMFIIHEEVPLGEIIEAVIDYNSLPHELKISYNELMTYLAENPQFLQGNNDFAFENFDTKGAFLKGLFTYFLRKPKISSRSKKYLEQLIPVIKLSGAGAEKMHHVTIQDVTNGHIPVLMQG